MDARESEMKGVERALGPKNKEAESEEHKAKRKAFEAKDNERIKALAAVANAGKQDLVIAKEREETSQRIAEAQKDIADSIRSQWTFSEKFNDARADLLYREATYQESLKKGTLSEQERALASRDESKAKFMELKQTAIERAAMPISEQNKLQEQEKKQARDRQHAERTVNAQERDKLDRAFRRGEITKDARDHMIEALGARKFGETPDTPEKQTAVHTRQIAASVKVLAAEIKKL